MLYPVADPDIQIRRRMGGHPDPEIRGRPGLKKKFFSALRASVWSKKIGGGPPPGPLPWIRHCYPRQTQLETLLSLRNNIGNAAQDFDFSIKPLMLGVAWLIPYHD